MMRQLRIIKRFERLSLNVLLSVLKVRRSIKTFELKRSNLIIII
jgi:hypothetical protein